MSEFSLAGLLSEEDSAVALTPEPTAKAVGFHHAQTCAPAVRPPTARLNGLDGGRVCATARKATTAGEAVKVFVRVKPLLANSRPGTAVPIAAETLFVDDDKRSVSVSDKRTTASYTYDGVLPGDTTQQDVFKAIGADLVSKVLDGYNGTIFAYGQTGSGKTYTMFNEDKMSGLTYRAIDRIFHSLEQAEKPFEVWISVCEVYNEQLFSLLAYGGVTRRLSSVQEFKTERPWPAPSAEAAKVMVVEALKQRKRDETAHNVASSRSHCTVRISIVQSPSGMRLLTASTSSSIQSFVSSSPVPGRAPTLYLVDLAGSESIQHASGTPQKSETKNINKSLAALQRVFSCLEAQATHIPYRDSTLTQALQDGLCPLNARVVLCATVSPLADDLEPTKSTLSFARNVRNVRSFAKINQAKPEPGMQHALLLKQAAQLQQLRAQVAQLQQDAADMQERLETVPELEAGKADAEGAVQRMQADLTAMATQHQELQQATSLHIQHLQAQLHDAQEGPRNELQAERARSKQLQEALEATQRDAAALATQLQAAMAAARQQQSAFQADLAHERAAAKGEREQAEQFRLLLQASKEAEAAQQRRATNLTGQLAATAASCDAAHEQVRALQADAIAWRARAAAAEGLHEQLATAGQHSAALEARVAELQELCEAAQAGQQQQDAELHAELAALQAQGAEEAAAAAAEAQLLREQLAAAAAAAAAEGEASRQACNELELLVEQLEGERGELLATRRELEGRLEEERVGRQALMAERSQGEAELQLRCGQAEGRCAELGGQLAERDVQLEALRREHASAREALQQACSAQHEEALAAEQAARDDALAVQQQAYADALAGAQSAHLEEMTSQQAAHAAALRQAQGEVQRLRAEAEQLQAACGASQHEAEEAGRALLSAQAEAERLRAERDEAAARAAGAEASAAAMDELYRSDVQTPRREAKAAEERCKQMAADMARMEQQAKRNAEEAAALKDAWAAERELMQRQIRTLQRHAEQLQAEKQQLQADAHNAHYAAASPPSSPSKSANSPEAAAQGPAPQSAPAPGGFALLSSRTTTVGAAELRRINTKDHNFTGQQPGVAEKARSTSGGGASGTGTSKWAPSGVKTQPAPLWLSQQAYQQAAPQRQAAAATTLTTSGGSGGFDVDEPMSPIDASFLGDAATTVRTYSTSVARNKFNA